MTDVEIIKLVFGIFLAVGGFVLLLLSFLITYKYLVMDKKCTAKIQGTVKQYSLASRGGAGIHLPVVEYNVNGKTHYVVGPEFKGYIIKEVSTPLTTNSNMEYSIKDNKLYVNYSSNSLVTIHKNPMEDIYPINSNVDVFYNPNKPKQAYVLRYCGGKKWYFWLMFISSIIILGIDIAIQILL